MRSAAVRHLHAASGVLAGTVVAAALVARGWAARPPGVPILDVGVLIGAAVSLVLGLVVGCGVSVVVTLVRPPRPGRCHRPPVSDRSPG